MSYSEFQHNDVLVETAADIVGPLIEATGALLLAQNPGGAAELLHEVSGGLSTVIATYKGGDKKEGDATAIDGLVYEIESFNPQGTQTITPNPSLLQPVIIELDRENFLKLKPFIGEQIAPQVQELVRKNRIDEIEPLLKFYREWGILMNGTQKFLDSSIAALAAEDIGDLVISGQDQQVQVLHETYSRIINKRNRKFIETKFTEVMADQVIALVNTGQSDEVEALIENYARLKLAKDVAALPKAVVESGARVIVGQIEYNQLHEALKLKQGLEKLYLLTPEDILQVEGILRAGFSNMLLRFIRTNKFSNVLNTQLLSESDTLELLLGDTATTKFKKELAQLTITNFSIAGINTLAAEAQRFLCQRHLTNGWINRDHYKWYYIKEIPFGLYDHTLMRIIDGIYDSQDTNLPPRNLYAALNSFIQAYEADDSLPFGSINASVSAYMKITHANSDQLDPEIDITPRNVFDFVASKLPSDRVRLMRESVRAYYLAVCAEAPQKGWNEHDLEQFTKSLYAVGILIDVNDAGDVQR
jgi:hypothetical protein